MDILQGDEGTRSRSGPSRYGAVPGSVRAAALDVLRRLGLTTMFSNPGSTGVPFLAGLPEDFRFVLALHEASVIGMASGWAIGRDEPAFALLHTTAGLGNADAKAPLKRLECPWVVRDKRGNLVSNLCF